jgi:hypothetical protein
VKELLDGIKGAILMVFLVLAMAFIGSSFDKWISTQIENGKRCAAAGRKAEIIQVVKEYIKEAK